MSDLERRKDEAIRRIGKEAVDVLKEAGIDVESAVRSILRGQQEEEGRQELETAVATTDNCMTSELAYRSTKIEDMFGKEYVRRLRLMGLSDKDISNLYGQEKSIASSDVGREQAWVRRYFIMPDTTPETLPKPEELTLSELILITDDANSAFYRDHEHLPDKAWEALCIAACCASYTEARYVKAFDERISGLGWSKTQNGAYTRNECLLTERFKWGNHNDPAWTKETTDLKKFER